MLVVPRHGRIRLVPLPVGAGQRIWNGERRGLVIDFGMKRGREIGCGGGRGVSGAVVAGRRSVEGFEGIVYL
jgi:hypothetical protein